MTEYKAQPETFDLRSQNIAEEKRQELLRLFPEVRTEGDKIDFDRLKLALGEAVDVGKERYGMNWPGTCRLWNSRTTSTVPPDVAAAYARTSAEHGRNHGPSS